MVKQTQIDNEITLFTAEHSHVNAVLIEYDNFLVCVDTLYLPKDSKELLSFIQSRNKPLKYLFNTHGHSDHCLGNRFLKQPDTFIIAHEKFAFTNWAEHAFLKNARTSTSITRIQQPDICFSENLEILECQLQILHTPGHSPDASVIYLPDKKILITGDTVLNSDSNLIAIPYFYSGDLDIMLKSLEKLSDMDVQSIIPGHGIPGNSMLLARNIQYLRNFKLKLDAFMENNTHLKVEEMKEMVFMEIGIEDCLPGTKKEDFWVPKMHQLNIERYIEWKIEGNSVYTLTFPNQNNL